MMRSLLLLCVLVTGCARLAPGDLSAISRPQLANVILIRGYQDWYSTGIDQLTTQIRSRGIHAEAFREEQWRDLADTLVRHPHPPIVLIGFSYGADDVILIARRLNDAHQPVALLITIDPVTPADIPANVPRSINYYEPNGIWDIFPWLRGVPVNADPGGAVENINVRSRADLNLPDTSHATIAGNSKIHAAIISVIEQQGGR